MSGVTKDYGSGRGIFDVDLAIARGSIHGLLGPNGAGKTTLMRVVLGLVRSAAGSVTLFGSPAGSTGAMSRVGALIESPRMRPTLSGRENLQYLAMLAGRRDEDVSRVLGAVGLSGAASSRFGTYSLGMKQRLGLAAALLKDPDLLILDEPMNGLDPLGMADVRSLLVSLREQGRTILLSSHQMADVESVCDRVTVLDAGRVVADDTLAAFSRRGGGVDYLIEAEPNDRLHAVLSSDPRVRCLRVSDGETVVGLTEEDAPSVLHDMVVAGLRVRRFTAVDVSLEQAFLGAISTRAEGSDAFAAVRTGALS